MTPTQARLAAERKARLARMNHASLQHFDRCYDEAQTVLPKIAPPPLPPKPVSVKIAEAPQPFRLPLKIVSIQGMVAERFNITRAELVGPCKKTQYVRPRQIAIYLTRKATDLSLPKIGKSFGGRDHTTILFSVRCVESMMKRDPEYAALVDEIGAEIAA